MQHSDFSASSGPVSGDLAKRLAAAADGLRDGKIYYFISRKEYASGSFNKYDPFDLDRTDGHENNDDGLAAAQAQAQQILSDKGAGFYIFGPYLTPPEIETFTDFDAIEVRFLKNSAEVFKKTFEKNIDALVFSLAAYDKFYMPYYSGLYGPQVAANMRTTDISSSASIQDSSGKTSLLFLGGHSDRTSRTFG